MDPATLIGVVVGLIVIVIANIMEGGNPTSLLLVAPLLLVFGAHDPGEHRGRHDERRQVSPRRRSSRRSPPRSAAAGLVVPTVVKLAEKARRRACSPSRTQLKDIDDPFLKRGLQMAIDGTDPEELRDILEAEIARQEGRGQGRPRSSSTDVGGYAPTIGIIGTVLGLIHVLENLAKPEELGHLIAGAFVATLWGVLSANLFWLPDRQPDHADQRARGRPDGAADRGHHRDPGRLQPAGRRARSCARCCPPRPSGEAGGGLMTHPAPASAASTRSTRSTRTTSAGWSPTPTWSRCSWCCSSCCSR